VKALLLLLTAVIAGCVTAQPMPLPDGSSGYSLNECPDQAWCYRKAAKVCGGKFEVINEQGGTGLFGTDYRMSFRCTG
jgi:hypothetical protein